MNLMSFLFEVTSRCNNDCVFCYNVWKENADYPRGELSFKEIKLLFDKVLLGIPTGSIHLGGGEPLLRADLEDIVSYFRSKKMAVSVSTNGLILDEKRAKSLRDSGVTQFEITLLSMDGKMHNELCANNGCYDKACEAIINARKLKVRTNIAFVATKRNIADISQILDFSFALGVQGLAFYRFIPTGRGLMNQEQLAPDFEQINTALEILDNKSKDYNLKVFIGIPIERCILKKKLKNIKLTFCQAGLSKFTIDYLGNLRICEQSPEILGNLFENTFLSLALNKRVSGFRRFVKKRCLTCKHKRICRGGCRFLNRKE